MSKITNSTTNDNSIYWNNLILILNENISKYVMGFIWLLGNFGSTINCIILSQSNLRKNPCVMYFLASSASQFLTFNFALLTRILQFGYGIQAINTFFIYCKIRYYLFYISVAVPRYYIILASVDRYVVSSSNMHWRQLSSSKIALRLIIGTALFWSLIYIQVPFLYEIQVDGCSLKRGIYSIYFGIYLLIESGLIPPLMMMVFGILTLNNIQESKRRIRPLTIPNTAQSSHFPRMTRTDLQIYKMLFNQICLWISLNIIHPCYFLYRAITINDTKSPLRLTVELFINNISYFLLYLGFSLTFFIYILSSAFFRRKLNQLIRTKISPHFILNVLVPNAR